MPTAGPRCRLPGSRAGVSVAGAGGPGAADYYTASHENDELARRTRRLNNGSVTNACTYAYDATRLRPCGTTSLQYGSVTGLVDTNGTNVAHYAYDAFGNTIGMTNALAEANPFRFSSKYFDAETELYYYGQRYCSPQLGRWISRDPTGENGQLHVYGFVNNRPSSLVDVIGLAPYGENNLPTMSIPGDSALSRSYGRSAPDERVYLPPEQRCGDADVTTHLRDVLARVDTAWTVDWDEGERCRRCAALLSPITAGGAWDIEPLSWIGGVVPGNGWPFPGKPGGNRVNEDDDTCKRTVQFQGNCYWATDLNYVAWGHFTRLCYEEFGSPYQRWKMLGIVHFYKLFFRFEVRGNAVEFAAYGYDDARLWTAAPAGCRAKSCAIEATVSPTEAFGYTWRNDPW